MYGWAGRARLSGVDIRPVELADAVSLTENCFTLNTVDEVRANVERALAQAEAGDGVSLVAVTDGRVLANVTVSLNAHRLRRHRAHLGGFVIHPDSQGSGLARRLTAASATWAQDKGCELLEIEVRGGTSAEAAYLRLGFTEWARLPGGLVEDAGTYDEVCLYLSIPEWLGSSDATSASPTSQGSERPG